MFRRTLLILALSFACQANADSLAPEHEMRRLLFVAEESIEAERFAQAQEALDKVAELNITPTVQYYFYRGRVAMKSGEYEKAREAFVRYVNLAGSDGDYYEESLRAITRLDDQLKPPKQTAESTSIDWSKVVENGSGEYLQKLRGLYLAGSDQSALVQHINSLLAANVYIPSRIRKLNEEEGIVYRVSVNSRNEIVLQETNYLSANVSHNVSRFKVFGVDPYVRTGCDLNQRACWLWNPENQDEKWLMITENKSAVDELSRAMTELIKLLQS
ncbi:tetratricopeptide repeat protein [Hahella sp. KA22]|uniref:tetratricopeptide repeat protein n=1 Tax=Hahella sp. KA22 TaxID=1628392 RepID=UPI000FDF1EF8|nr:tetratricopeptide repeat protein [Hahella sp. KA22]AZZ91115.1 tetratricopeptide repeat protein [Hahella sp. KA22]QAY54483.1 tetratricopeptide repeat protein [Hahella sp. KA22]